MFKGRTLDASLRSTFSVPWCECGNTQHIHCNFGHSERLLRHFSSVLRAHGACRLSLGLEDSVSAFGYVSLWSLCRAPFGLILLGFLARYVDLKYAE